MNNKYLIYNETFSLNYWYFIRYIFLVRDGIGNCLQIILSDVNGLYIEMKTRNYIFHQIEFIERIESPKESNRWPYEDYPPPKKLFCFRSINNQVSILWSLPFFSFVSLYEWFYSKIKRTDCKINVNICWKRYLILRVWVTIAH
jgi:hypothetical protein